MVGAAAVVAGMSMFSFMEPQPIFGRACIVTTRRTFGMVDSVLNVAVANQVVQRLAVMPHVAARVVIHLFLSKTLKSFLLRMAPLPLLPSRMASSRLMVQPRRNLRNSRTQEVRFEEVAMRPPSFLRGWPWT